MVGWCSLDTLFIDNNSPMQWSIKMKFAPLGSPLICFIAHAISNVCYLAYCVCKNVQ